MRRKALILLIPFVVFLTETASYIPAMADACIIKAAEQSSCCMKEMAGEGGCQDEKAGSKEDSGKSCEESPECINCPVCYTFIFQSQFEWQPTVLTFKKNYSLLTTGHISSYTTDVWKPPNGSFYYI